ncbi:hypothetical protein LAJ19_03040 [Deinococcus taeanensis]|nr:hypothetical protein [Deinococcus taeanensis]UBV43209.1 hypothetical protein LAJ19_03040 [Deinococcus taeanensis]
MSQTLKSVAIATKSPAGDLVATGVHDLTVDVGPLGEAPRFPDLQVTEPRLHAQLIDNGSLPDADVTFDALASQELEPLAANELSVGDQALPACRWKGLQHPGDQLDAPHRAAVAVVIQSGPDEWHCGPVEDDAKDQEIHGRLAALPGGAVYAEQQCPWGQQRQQASQEDGFGELGITAPSFHPAFLYVDGAPQGR